MGAPNINTFEPAFGESFEYPSMPDIPRGSRVSVVGGGSFGGWAALHLLREGYDVTLYDAWGSGNSRSSSGDETRVTRSTYGKNELYFRMNARSLQLWRENENFFSKPVFINSGVLWFCYQEKTPLVDDSIPYSKKYGMEYVRLSTADLRKDYPQVNSADLHHAYLDPYGGYLLARESCQEVNNLFVKEGGRYLQKEVKPGRKNGSRVNELLISDGSREVVDVLLFACGSWLPLIFPDELQHVIKCTRQEVYYFGVPAAEASAFDAMPAWIDADGKDFYYGIPGNALRGFKIGVDKRGETFNPTSGERTPVESVLREARQFLGHRFPALRYAPLVESRVCPYENSPSGNFIFDLLPGTENVFLLGGGSGHGFKHGPALGELVARVFAGKDRVPDAFRLARYHHPATPL